MLAMEFPLRAAQSVLALVTMGLIGYSCHWFVTHSTTMHSPSQVSFLLFCAVWALLVTPILFFIPRKIDRAFTKWVVFGLDFTTMAFELAGFVNLAVFNHKLILCYGHICRFMVASIVFGGLLWALFLVSTTLAGLNAMRKADTTTKAEQKEKDLETSPPSTRGNSVA